MRLVNTDTIKCNFIYYIYIYIYIYIYLYLSFNEVMLIWDYVDL